MSFLEKNTEQIAKYNKLLADKIANHVIGNDIYRLDYTKCDDLNLYINEVPVHDEVDALGQAQHIWNNADHKGPDTTHIIYGFGLGYLFSRFAKEAKQKIIIYEPNIDVLRIAFGVFDFSEYLSNPLIRVVNDQFNLKAAIEAVSFKDDQVTMYFLPYHKQQHQEDIDNFTKELVLIKSLINVGFKELASKSKYWAIATARNLFNISKNEELEAIRDKFKDKPAIIISAGPSLMKNIETIKKYRDKVVIIAVGVALRALINNGIKPDFAAIIELGNCLHNLEGLDVSGINFIFPPEVNPSIYDYKIDRAFNYYTENLFTSDWVVNYTGIDCLSYMNRGTVSITATWSSKILGCNPIILTGQDLAYVDGNCYAGNALFGLKYVLDEKTGEFDFKLTDVDSQKNSVSKYFSKEQEEEVLKEMEYFLASKRKDLATVKGQNGELLPTSRGYALFVKHFEELIPELQDRKMFNCSQGGAQINGYENVIMEDVLKEFATEKVDVDQIINDALESYKKPSDVEQKLEFLTNILALMEKFAPLSEKGLSLCRNFNNQLKRKKILKQEMKEILMKTLNVYCEIIGQYFSKNRYIMSLAYGEYLAVEAAIKEFETSQSDDKVLNLAVKLSDFFSFSSEFSKSSLEAFKLCKKQLSENFVAKN